MFSSNDKISLRQLQILVILVLLSSNSLRIPHKTADLVEHNGWMLIVIGIFITLFFLYLITRLARKFPDKTFADYSKIILSKPIGGLLSLVFAAKLIVFVGLELRAFGELVKQTLLFETPIEIIIMSMLFVVAFLARKGYECRARISEIIIFLAFVPIVIVLLFAMKNVQLSNLAPVLAGESKDFLTGSYKTALLFGGIELLLLSYPFVRNKKGIFKAISQSVLIVGVAAIFLTVITIGIFGAKETARQIWPVMSIMQVVEVPGAFIERQDALMMSFWILTVFTLINAYLYFSSLIVSRVFETKEMHYINLILLPIIYVISLIPDNVPSVYEMIDQLQMYTGIIFLLPVPLLLLIIAKIRKLGEE